MKKTFILLFTLLLMLGAFVLEGGGLKALFIGTALVPVFLGPLMGAWFCFSWGEIARSFNNAFTDRVDPGQLYAYKGDLLVIKNLQSGLIFWAFTIVILGIIGILCILTDISHLGHSVAAALTSLLLASALRAWLLSPMESSIMKKLLYLEQCPSIIEKQSPDIHHFN